MARLIKVGTRGSPLALWQTNSVVDKLRELYPEYRFDSVVIKTKGDVFADVPLARMGGKGVFVKEIEEALLSGRIDMAVHSLKDLPAELPAGLAIGAVPQREDAHDVLVSPHRNLAALPLGARLGTSSTRRAAQVKRHRPDLQIVNLRGNLETRLRKAEGGELEGAILAAAGLLRLGLRERISQYIPFDLCLPAVGQGALAVEVRGDDEELIKALSAIEHRPSRQAVDAERAFLAALGGGCQVPIAAHAALDGEILTLEGLVVAPAGDRWVQSRIQGVPNEAEALGKELAERLLQMGARELLEVG